jgi:hypothetical protein
MKFTLIATLIALLPVLTLASPVKNADLVRRSGKGQAKGGHGPPPTAPPTGPLPQTPNGLPTYSVSVPAGHQQVPAHPAPAYQDPPARPDSPTLGH